MSKETPIQRTATLQMQPAIRRLGRPVRGRPVEKQKPEPRHSRASIRRWMMANKEDYRDRRTGELNWTELVEAWDRACADGGATLDPDHIAWDIAVSLES